MTKKKNFLENSLLWITTTTTTVVMIIELVFIPLPSFTTECDFFCVCVCFETKEIPKWWNKTNKKRKKFFFLLHTHIRRKRMREGERQTKTFNLISSLSSSLSWLTKMTGLFHFDVWTTLDCFHYHHQQQEQDSTSVFRRI